MLLTSFSSKGKIQEIGKIKNFEKVSFIKLVIKLNSSEQSLDFYIAEKEDDIKRFRLITKYFGQYQPFKVGDDIEFDFNIVKNKSELTKLKIWRIYNKV